MLMVFKLLAKKVENRNII